MLKQLSSFSLIILATTSVIIAGENDPCNKYGWVGLGWFCNSVWGNPSIIKQKLPDVQLPNLEGKPKEIPAPVVKEESKTSSISLPEEILPIIQTPPQEKILVRSSVDEKSDKEEPKVTKVDEITTMRTFKVVSYDILESTKKEAQDKNLLGKLKAFAPLLWFNAMKYCPNAEIRNKGDMLDTALHKEELFIDRTKEQLLFKAEVVKAFWNSIIK